MRGPGAVAVAPGVGGVLIAGALAGWAAGASALFAAEVFVFPDLPAPPSGYLLRTLVGGGLHFVPLGLAIGVFLALALGLLSLARRRALSSSFGAGFVGTLLLGSLLVPASAVLMIAGVVGLHAAVLLAVGGLIVAAGVAAALARRSSALAIGLPAAAALLAPLWLVLVVPACGTPPRPGTPLPCAEGRRVVILGLDGATWDIIDSRLAPGELPNITRLTAHGVRATLISVRPILSNIVWTSAVTGVVPERHGITDFFFDRRFVRVPTLWDLVDQADGRVGLYKFLVTEPPLEVNGFVLPGWMTQNPKNTYPPRLVERFQLLTALHHPYASVRFLLQQRDQDMRYGYRELRHARETATAFIDLHLRFDPDIAACIWFGTDTLGHKTWRYMDPQAFAEPLPPGGERFRGALLDCYREADRQLGRVIRALDDGQTLFVLMSDHGMGPTERIFRRAHVRGSRILEMLDLDERFYIPSPHAALLLNARLPGRVEPATVTPAEHASVVEAAAQRFRSVCRAQNQEPLFEVEVIVSGELDLRVRVADATTLESRTPLTIDGHTFPAYKIVQFFDHSGTHRLEGILVLAGPGIRTDGRIAEASIMDVAPTVLRGLGLPVSTDLDGRVLESAFTPEWLAAHPAREVDAYRHEAPTPPDSQPINEALLERLRSLGYIQ